MRANDRRLRFSRLLMAILSVIIVTVVLAGIWTSYEASRSNLEMNANCLRVMTEAYIDNSFLMIDTGLKLYDNTYNEEMRDAFVTVMAEYNLSGGDPARMDLEDLKS